MTVDMVHIPLTTSIGPTKASFRILYLSPTSNRQASFSRANFFQNQIPLDVAVDFYNAPPLSPCSIDGTQDGILSAAVVLNDLGLNSGNGKSKYNLQIYAAIIIGCFSDHPLISLFRGILKNGPTIISLLEAGIEKAVKMGKTYGIATTGQQWEKLFDEAIREQDLSWRKYVGTRGCGFNAVNLHKSDALQAILRIAQELVQDGAEVIILGCGGMTTLRGTIERDLEKESGRSIPVVDGVQAAIEQGIVIGRMMSKGVSL